MEYDIMQGQVCDFKSYGWSAQSSKSLSPNKGIVYDRDTHCPTEPGRPPHLMRESLSVMDRPQH